MGAQDLEEAAAFRGLEAQVERDREEGDQQAPEHPQPQVGIPAGIAGVGQCERAEKGDEPLHENPWLYLLKPTRAGAVGPSIDLGRKPYATGTHPSRIGMRVEARWHTACENCRRPDYQGRGLARALVREFVDLAESLGIAILQAEILDVQKKARRLFEDLGFQGVATLPQHAIDLSGRVHDILIHTLTITPPDQLAPEAGLAEADADIGGASEMRIRGCVARGLVPLRR